MKTRLRRWWPVPAVVLVALGVYAIMRPDPIDVDVAAATRGPMQVVVNEEGRTRVRDRYTVAAPVSGRLERIELREGASVAAGQVVARIAGMPLDVTTRRQAEARVQAAQANERSAQAVAAQARAALDNARAAFERRERLANAGGISREAFEASRLDVELREADVTAADAAVAATSAELQAARAALVSLSAGPAGTVAVRAPAAGRVLRVYDASARVIAAGTPLLEIGETSAIEVIVPVLSADAVRIEPNACVLIEAWGGETGLEGRVRLVEPSAFTRVSALGIEEQRVNVIIDLHAAPPELRDGYRVEAGIIVWESNDVLQVPASAVSQRGDRWIVFVVEDGRALSREVLIGQRNGAAVEIIEGIEEGELVILFPSDLIDDGVRVRVRG